MNFFPSLYIHIPFCVSKCTYCDFFSVPVSKVVSDEYIQKVCDEIEYKIKKNKVSQFSSVYFGGGTPSLLSINQVKKVMEKIKPFLKENAYTEITFELNCDDIKKEYLEGLIECGINRFSVGIQTLNEKSLACIKRRSSSKTALEAMKIVSEIAFSSCKISSCKISADFIAGLPYASEENLLQDLKTAIELNFKHISLYSLTIEENTPLYKQIKNGEFDYDEEKIDEIWISGRNFLLKNGFEQYEISNFAKNDEKTQSEKLNSTENLAPAHNYLAPAHDNRSFHNRTYWKLQSYLGVGAGAVSSIYEKSFGRRISNKQNIKSYLKCKDFAEIQETEILDKKTLMFEYLMTGLRTSEGVNSNEFFMRFGEDMEKFLPRNTELLIEQGKMQKKEHFYRLSPEGMLFLNQILVDVLDNFDNTD